jgi:3-oxoacyl-[acyl-carrier protein] reductase
MSTLKGKVAFVTGGSRSIGAAIVKRLAAEGADVAFTYSNSAEKANALVEEIEKNGIKALAIQADSAIKNEAAKAIDQAAAYFGKLDILVNNAGIVVFGHVESSAEQVDDYDRQIDINIRAVTESVKAAVKHLSPGGRIITIGSSGGTRIGMPYMAEYVATKGAVAAYSRALAWDLGAKNITVNVVAPGPIVTDANPEEGEFQDKFRETIALKRYGKVEEVAALVNFLAGPEANYITGATFAIDGGITA